MNTDAQITPWIKASASDANGNCVQMRRSHASVQIRDSKLGDGSPILSLDPADFGALLNAAKRGDFDHLG